MIKEETEAERQARGIAEALNNHEKIAKFVNDTIKESEVKDG